MFIPMWVIYLVVVLALVVIPVFMVFSIRRNTNVLMKKLDDKFEKMSSELKLYAVRSSFEPKSINSPKSNYEAFSMSFIGYVRDINACIVFFTLTFSATLFFLIKKNGLESNTISDIVLPVSFVISFLPSVILLFRLIESGITFRKWKAAGMTCLFSITVLVVIGLVMFSVHTLIPNVLNILKSYEIIS